MHHISMHADNRQNRMWCLLTEVCKNNHKSLLYKNFNNTILSYLIDIKEFQIDDVLNRFTQQAKIIFS